LNESELIQMANLLPGSEVELYLVSLILWLHLERFLNWADAFFLQIIVDCGDRILPEQQQSIFSIIAECKATVHNQQFA
jgi:hypothetical protein